MSITSASTVSAPEAARPAALAFPVSDAAAAREDLCRFLAGCYYEPGPEFAEEKLFESMLAAARRVHPELAEHAARLGATFAAASLEESVAAAAVWSRNRSDSSRAPAGAGIARSGACTTARASLSAGIGARLGITTRL